MKEGWEIKKLGEVCDVLNGLWVGKKEPFVNVCVIRNTNFTKDCKLNLDNVAYIDVEEKQYLTRKLKLGDIIVEKSGGSDKQPVGRVVLFDIEDGDFSFSNFTSALRVKSVVDLNSRFLHKCLYAHYLRGETFKLQSKTTGLHNLDMKGYLRLSIPIPPLEEQERIVGELDCLSGVIEKKKQQLKELDALAQSIFYEMFGNECNEWDKVKLIDVYKFIDYRGKTPNKITEGIPLITARNIRKGYIDYSVREYISEAEFTQRQSRGVARKGDLLFTTEAPMGYVAIADLDVFSTGQRLITFQKKQLVAVNNTYVLHYLLSNRFQFELNSQATGATVKGIKGSKLEQMRIECPPLSLQQEFAEKIESIDKQKELIRKSIEEVEMLFNSRMDYYFV